MSYAWKRVTEELYARANKQCLDKRMAEFYQWPWAMNGELAPGGLGGLPAEFVVMLTQEWQKFRENLIYMQEQYEKMEAGTLPQKDYEKVYRRFQQNVIEPLERRWEKLRE